MVASVNIQLMGPVLCCLSLQTLTAQAQIIPDAALPPGVRPTLQFQDNISGQITTLINGGIFQDNKLLHQFSDFNINPDDLVYFDYSDQLGTVETIFTRVNGNNTSTISGTLGVLGNANLFLSNPNGIIFNNGAKLDLNGTFLATTAQDLNIENNTVNLLEASPQELLSINSNALFSNALSNYQGDITQNGILNLNPSQELSLIGKTVIINGEIQSAQGDLNILGDRLIFTDTALLDVSAPNGGGNLIIGGHPKNSSLPTANQVAITPDATFLANAIEQGNGGDIIIWSDGQTLFTGNISAKGGRDDGNGGFIEVSGQNLVFRGQVNTTAPNGNIGTLLLDPVDIEIRDGSNDGNDNGTLSNAFGNDPLGSNGTVLGNDPTPTIIYESELESLTETTSITLEATNNITLKPLASDGILEFSNLLPFFPGQAIIFRANSDGIDGGNFIFEDPTNTIKTNGHSLTISGNELILGNLDTDAFFGGRLTLNSLDGDINVLGKISTENTVTMQSIGGSINLQDFDASGLFFFGNLDFSVDLKADNNIQLNGDIAPMGTFRAIADFDQNGMGDFIVTDPTQIIATYAGTEITAQNIQLGNLSDIANITLNAAHNIQLENILPVPTNIANTFPVLTTIGPTVEITAGRALQGQQISTAPSDFVIPFGGVFNGGDLNIRVDNDLNLNNIETLGGTVDIETLGEIQINQIKTNETDTIPAVESPGNIQVKTPEKVFIDTLQTSSNEFSSIGGNINIIGDAGIEIHTIDSKGGALGGNISLAASKGDISTNNIQTVSIGSFGTSGDVNISSGGNISVENIRTETFGFLGDSGDVNISANNNIIVNQIDANGNFLVSTISPNSVYINAQGSIDILNHIHASAGRSSDIQLVAGTDISTGNLLSNYTSDEGTISLEAGNNITTQNISLKLLNDSNTLPNRVPLAINHVDIQAGNNVITEKINTSNSNQGRNVGISAGGSVQTDDITTTSTALNLDSAALFSNDYSIRSGGAGNVFVQAIADVSLGNIDTTAERGIGGNVTLTSAGNIQTKTIKAIGGFERGGDIFIQASGNILADDVIASGNAGGNILLDAAQTLQATNLESQARRLFLSNTEVGDFIGIDLTAFNESMFADLVNTIPQDQIVDVLGIINLGDGGNIQLKSGNQLIFQRTTTDAINGDAGNIKIQSEVPLILNNAEITANALGQGKGGDIQLQAPIIQFDNTRLSSAIAEFGTTGEISLTASDRITLTNNSQISNEISIGAVGDSKGIQLTAPTIQLTNNAYVDSSTFGFGQAGNIEFQVDNLSLENSGILALTAGQGDAGSLDIRGFSQGAAQEIHLDQSQLSTAVSDRTVGNGGDIQIFGDRLLLENGSQIQALTKGTGTSGAINLILNDELTIAGFDQNGFLSGVFTSSEAADSGQGGKLTVQTDKLNLSNAGILSSQTFSSEAGGDIQIQAKQATLNSGGQIVASTQGLGQAGQIELNISETLTISGTDPSFGDRPIPAIPPVIPLRGTLPTFTSESTNNNSLAAAQTINADFILDPLDDPQPNLLGSTFSPYVVIAGQGEDAIDIYRFDAGAGTRGIFDIDFSTADTKLTLLDEQGNTLATNDNASPLLGGRGTDPNIQPVTQLVSIVNGAAFVFFIPVGGDVSPENRDPYISYAFNETGSYFLQVESLSGNTGEYTLFSSLRSPNVSGSTVNAGNRSGIFANTSGLGNAGDIIANIGQNLIIDQGGAIAANTLQNSFGDSGNIFINAPQIQVLNQAGIEVNSLGQGVGGNIQIRGELLELAQLGHITAETLSSDGGNILIDLNRALLMSDASVISATAGLNGLGGNGGNIEINVPFWINFPGATNQAIANAFAGNGGNINISTNSIFGRQYLNISASSRLGLDGSIIIDTPNIDPTSGLVELPENFTDPSNQIDEACQTNRQNSFVLSGRGGIPESFEQSLWETPTWIDLRSPQHQNTTAPDISTILPLDLQPNYQATTLKKIPASNKFKLVGHTLPSTQTLTTSCH